MKFNWKGLLLAPLVVSILFSLALLNPGDKHPFFGFVLLAVIGSIISYGTTIFLFLPCLVALARLTPLNLFKVCALGLLLGIFVFFPCDVGVISIQRPRLGSACRVIL